MDPATIAILVGALAASSAASVYTNSQNIKYAQEANEESVALANTAHQREVRDLRAAGLNPILSASGSGSAVPQLKVPSLENPLGDLNSSAGSLASAVNGMTKSQIDLAREDVTSAKLANQVAANERDISDVEAPLQRLEAQAKYEALSGIPQMSRDSHSKAYNDLVQMTKNQIAAGEYTSGVGHAVYKDIRDGISSAKDVGDLILTGKKIKAPLPNPVGKRERRKLK